MIKNYRLTLTVNLIVIVIVILVRGFLPPVIPLFYGKAIGEGQLSNSFGLLIPPLASLLIAGVNFSFTKWLLKESFLKDVLAYSSFFVTVLSTITVLKIIFLVGNL